MIKNFINLTNGIYAIPFLNEPNIHFIRIQSTTCEQKRWNFILQDLDNNLLMSLALGYNCIIYDYSSVKNIPRSVYQGLEIIKFILTKKWLNKEIEILIKTNNCTNYCREIYKKLDKRTHKKLEYYQKFLITDKIKLSCITGKIESRDNNIDYYLKIIKEYVKKQQEKENKFYKQIF